MVARNGGAWQPSGCVSATSSRAVSQRRALRRRHGRATLGHVATHDLTAIRRTSHGVAVFERVPTRTGRARDAGPRPRARRRTRDDVADARRVHRAQARRGKDACTARATALPGLGDATFVVRLACGGGAWKARPRRADRAPRRCAVARRRHDRSRWGRAEVRPSVMRAHRGASLRDPGGGDRARCGRCRVTTVRTRVAHTRAECEGDHDGECPRSAHAAQGNTGDGLQRIQPSTR